jgi:predicted permease
MPKPIRRFAKAVGSIFRKRKAEAELDRELRFHLENEVEQNVARGFSREEARLAALRKFGGVERVKEECRDTRGTGLVESIASDLGYCIRSLGKRPAFTAIVVITLALGIGANAAVFSVVNALLLRPYPFRDLDRLVLVRESGAAESEAQRVAPADFIDLRNGNDAFEELAAYRYRGLNLTGTGEPERVDACMVSPNFFDMIGVRPAQGNGFYPDQELEGKDHTAILSYPFWQRQFGGDPAVLGSTIKLNGKSYTVVGIMPQRFNYPLGSELWIPLALSPQDKVERTAQVLFVLGRLKQGAFVNRGLADVQSVAERLEREYPATNTHRTMSLIKLREEQYGYTAPLFLMLQGAALLVLLLACANVANLLLARVISRQKEIAIRQALGSSRRRLAQLLLSETAVISLLASVSAALIAYWSANVIRTGIPEGISKYVAGWEDIKVDGRVLGGTLAVAAIAGVLFGLGTAVHSSRSRFQDALKEGRTSGEAPGRRRLRSTLVIAEVVLSMLLLVGAGLITKGFFHLVDVFQGFQPRNVLTFNVSLPDYRYKDDAGIADFYDRALRETATVPEVQSISLVTNIPASNVPNDRTFFNIEGKAVLSADEAPSADLQVISAGFLDTLRIPLVRGRALSERDGKDTPRAAVISSSMSSRYWPKEDPLGARVKLGSSGNDSAWITIVGVAGDVKQNWWDPQPRPTIYLPYAQAPRRRMDVLVRTRDPLSIVAGVRAAIRRVDPEQAIQSVEPMEKSGGRCAGTGADNRDADGGLRSIVACSVGGGRLQRVELLRRRAPA